ncbi:copper amine oxidase N-terminal domain-containing protein [Paenibacillus doosanensis]|uniref:copper amine oxidase N-terminal domain-containing protein n=1 Tax=Paenibacillus doosanensis TaxID=1229154 RepID=UPI00217FCB48|nr:copper amine oxidase N-terminal domain-containing protein [Paenibacillus doosanensis]MCS7459388.1 copper amine oxidase N-terminal domain-containing protein [Paenibacillus doosanensis]
MKRWKRVLIMGAVLGGTFTAGVYAEDVLQRVEAYLRPDFSIVLDGKAIQLEGPTLVYQDKSYLPLKELGNMLGVNILWKGDNKTIYINSRINPEQPAEDANTTYEEFTLRSPSSQMVTYLGADYPLLTVYAAEGSTGPYYRLSDIRRMGIDTEGLKKSKEKLTGELYVSDGEARKRWGKGVTPSRTNRDNYVIAGELNSDKTAKLKDYVKSTASFKIKDFSYTTRPIMIEKIDGENRYEYLVYQTMYGRGNGYSITQSHYFRAILRLDTSGFGDNLTYTVNVESRTDLNDELEKKENQKAEDSANP